LHETPFKVMKPAQKLSMPKDHYERMHYIKRTFPAAQGPDLTSEWSGGRLSALNKLNSIDALTYGKNRNFLNGAVTQLSPYLRHGCLTLNETFDSIKKRFGAEADKLILQLAWRDYWRQVWRDKGNAIYSELEVPKVAIGHAPLTDDIRQGKTGLPCMDSFINDLLTTGYVHNHARMWLASYVVHHRKMDWRAAADWFESHLLDGDIASNHLSWQWVTSTFSSKPYFFNKESLGRYTGEKYCAGCKAECPFDASYEVLNDRLFDATLVPVAKQYTATTMPRPMMSGHPATAVFVHDEMLSAAHALLQQPFPKIFVFDPQLYGHWSLNRLQFVADCLNEMDGVEIWVGDTYEVLMQRGVGRIMTQDTPNLKIKTLLEAFAPKWEPVPKLVNVEISSKRLQRFSRYWEKVGPLVMSGSAV
jgi:deoxyribodipyrimidine photo-lyase